MSNTTEAQQNRGADTIPTFTGLQHQSKAALELI